MVVQAKPRLVIWGASHQAMVVADIIRLRGEYELVGFLDDVNPERHGTQFFGGTILGGNEQLDLLRQNGVEHLILGFGNSAARLRLSDLVREKGYRLATAIHPQAVVAADVPVGWGTVIKAGAVIDVGVSIGESVIVGAGAGVAHGSTLEDGARLSLGAIVGADVRVGRGAMIGISASIKTGTHIGAGSLIGVGAVVIEDVPDGVVAYGVPARVIRKVTADDGLGSDAERRAVLGRVSELTF